MPFHSLMHRMQSFEASYIIILSSYTFTIEYILQI